MATEQVRIIVPNIGRTLGQNVLPPFGTLARLDQTRVNTAPGKTLKTYTTLDGRVSFAAYDEEVEALKVTQDVTVEAAGVKATFTDSDSYAGYIVAGILVLVVGGYLFNTILK